MERETRRGQTEIGRDWLIAFALATGFLLVYLRTLCPTTYLGDSGQISTAIVTGGIIHPPGYPLFSLLGRASLLLVPWGEPAFRIGCVVALAAAAAVAALYFLMRELQCTPWASAAGAAAFGASYTFWNQSTRVEVYSLHVLLACLALLASLCYRRSGRCSHLALMTLAVSLGLAHHLTIVLIGPALLLLCGRRLWTDPGLGRRLATAISLALIGPSLYALLLIWARAEPLQDWGRPVTLPLLWAHASARFFQGHLHLPNGPSLYQSLRQAGKLYTTNFPYAILLLPLVGAWALWRRDRAVAAGLLLAGSTVAAYNFCYDITDIAPYYLAVWLVGTALLAVALDAIRSRARGFWKNPALAAVLCAVIPGSLILRNGSACDLSRATWARDLARHKLEHTDPGGVLITQGDHDTFPIWYVHDVLHVRPDVLPLDRAMLAGTWRQFDKEPSLWYLRRLRRQGVDAPLDVPRDLAVRASLATDGYLLRLLQRQLRDRPLCMTFAATHAPRCEDGPCFLRWALARYEMLPQGVVLRLQPKSQPVDLAVLLRHDQQLWDRTVLPDLHAVRTDEDLDPDYVVNHYACMLVNYGGLHELAGHRDQAAVIYRRVVAWAPHYRPAAAALASLRRDGRQAQLPSDRR
jgi:hypothetical protein